jgi:predicted TIM-barrel fold metal-dependent hydrolase
MDDGLVSADSHVLEPPDLWTERIDRRFRERAPHVVQQPDGRDLFVCEDLRPFPVSGLAVAGVDPREYGKRMFSGYAGIRPSGWDPVERLRDQDQDGVAGEVLYPSLGMPLYGIADGALRAACFRSYNDWLAELCGHAPGRLAGIALVPMDEVGQAVAELERAAHLGLRGGLIWGVPPDERRYDRDEWEPLWACAQDLGLPLSLHILTGARGMGVARSIMWDYPFLPHALERTIGDLIFGGVLQRFPGLRLVSAENDVGWIGHFLQRMDHSWEKYRYLEMAPIDAPTALESYQYTGRAPIPEPPSFYFRRQVSATFQEDPIGVRTRDAIGVANLMWASDFPHSDSTWPHSRDVVARDFAGVSDEERRAITRDNCAKLYGLG